MRTKRLNKSPDSRPAFHPRPSSPAASFWKTIKAKNADEWAGVARVRQTNLWDDVLGRLPAATLPANARSRKIYDKEKWTGHDVVLDVWPDVFAWGVLLLPKDLKPGERRPVVVCQHGLEGLPADTITDDPKASGYGAYKAFSARLAERGFVVFAPHNPYRGRDAFRGLQRKLNPLGQVPLEVLDFVVDSKNQKLIPNRRPRRGADDRGILRITVSITNTDSVV